MGLSDCERPHNYKKGRISTVQDKSRNSLTKDRKIITRWTEYCSDLYNHDTQGDRAVATRPHSINQDDSPILSEVEAAVKSLKKWKSAGVDNIPAELVQAGGEANLITIIRNLYDKATRAVLFSGSTGEWFRTAVGVRQGCLLSPTLFNIFLEKIMIAALENHEGNLALVAEKSQTCVSPTT